MKKIAIAAAVVGAGLTTGLALTPLIAAQDSRFRLAEPPVFAQGFGEAGIRLLRGGRMSIGVTVRDVTSDDVAKAKLDGARGVFVETVREGSPASRAGLRSGDVVLEYDGERVRSVQQFQRLVEETPAGRSVRATVSREGARQTLDVAPEDGNARVQDLLTLRGDRNAARQLPRDFAFNFDDRAPDIRTLVNPRQLGAALTPLSEQLETYFGVTNGVLVSSVQADSAASAAGLRAGDVITQVNGRRVEGPDDVGQVVRNTDAGAAIDLTVMRDKKEVKLKATIPDRRPILGRRGVTL